VAWYWKSAFERRGHHFRHIGSLEIGNLRHVRHFPKAAWQYYSKHDGQADIVLVHEPTAGVFAGNGIKTIVVSHGLERRGWEIQNRNNNPDLPKATLKTRLLYPFWRLRGCDAGLSSAHGALLINQDDKAFAMANYGLKEGNVFVFKNGVNLTPAWQPLLPENGRNILFIGTWVPRKGIRTLARAARILHDRGIKLQWVLAGTGLSADQVLRTWPECLHGNTRVIPRFAELEEEGLYRNSNLFVLPSFFEGQPLALLQAMAHGRCCITTNICGQKDIIHHGANGLLFEPGDANGLVRLIAECADNLPLQTALGENARAAIEDRDWGAAADEVVDFVERIAARKSNGIAVAHEKA
jgi:glycosyltransferase involved in cell wall biosynthesis